MQFVKRRGTTKAKVTPTEFQSLQEQFLGDIRSVVMLESTCKADYQLGPHWLKLCTSIILDIGGKGSQKVPIAAIDDKRQITAVLACSLAGDFLPRQIIYGGKTPGCLPKASFPPGWHVTYTDNHWANEESMLDYVRSIFLPFLEAAKKELKLPHSQPALALLDNFRGQLTGQFLDLLVANNIIIVDVPPNCTGLLQPLDLSVNKAIKDSLKSKFQTWYADRITMQLMANADKVIKPVDLHLAIMKPLSAKWLVEVMGEIGK